MSPSGKNKKCYSYAPPRGHFPDTPRIWRRKPCEDRAAWMSRLFPPINTSSTDCDRPKLRRRYNSAAASGNRGVDHVPPWLAPRQRLRTNQVQVGVGNRPGIGRDTARNGVAPVCLPPRASNRAEPECGRYLEPVDACCSETGSRCRISGNHSGSAKAARVWMGSRVTAVVACAPSAVSAPG